MNGDTIKGLVFRSFSRSIVQTHPAFADGLEDLVVIEFAASFEGHSAPMLRPCEWASNQPETTPELSRVLAERQVRILLFSPFNCAR